MLQLIRDKMKINISRKTIIIIISLLILLGIGRVLKVKGYIPKNYIYQSLVKLHILKPCYSAGVDMVEILRQEGFDYDQKNKEIILSSLNKLLDKNIKLAETPKIPTITHRVYLVTEDRTAKLDDFYIEEIKVNFNKLNDLGYNWQHNIWTNKASLFPDEIKNIKGVQIKNLTEFKDHPLYKYLLDILNKGNSLKPYLAEAADLTRLLAVQKFGGIYSDMDYEIYNPKALYDLMRKFDFIAGREIPSQLSYYGNAFFAARPNHPVINEALKIELRNRQLSINAPTYIKYPCNNYDTLYFNGPPLLTIAYFSKNNIDGNSDVILPPWMIFNLYFARFKNGISYNDLKIVPDLSFTSKQNDTKVCNYSLITKENFNISNQKMNLLFSNYIANITTKNFQIYYNINNANRDDLTPRDYENNIYYNLETRRMFDIIGADMFCGSWTEGGKVFRRKYYWSWQNTQK